MNCLVAVAQRDQISRSLGIEVSATESAMKKTATSLPHDADGHCGLPRKRFSEETHLTSGFSDEHNLGTFSVGSENVAVSDTDVLWQKGIIPLKYHK